MKKQNILYILSNGRVAAINKKDGTITWEVNLKAYGLSSVRHSIGQINVEEDKLFIGVAGILVCLSAKDGTLIWKNELKGWGYSFVSMANVNNEAAGAVAAQSAATNAVIASAG